MLTTQGFLFKAVAGDTKLKLLPSPWPSDALPESTSSLLSIASRKGLIAAGGPDGLVIANTATVRKAFLNSSGGDQSFEPEVKLPLPFRVSQLAFSADEGFLVVSADKVGGLVIYNVDALLQGNTNPAGEMNTDNTALRSLVPNPNPQTAALFAAITTSGQLLIADVKSQSLLNGPNGPLIKDGVSAVAWSNKGTQLVAGSADGTASQLTPQGELKESIPRAPEEGSDCYSKSCF